MTTGFGVTSAIFRSLRRYRFLISLQRRLERVPGERRAFNARRELADAGKNHQLAEIVGLAALAHDEIAEPLEGSLDLFDGLSLEALRHYGSRGLRDCTARAFEAQILHAAVLDAEINLHLIA